MSTRFSSLVAVYLGKQFLMAFLGILLFFIGLILIIDIIELMRRSSGKDDVTLGLILTMGVYKLPLTAQKTLPFAVLFGGMFAFWRLNRSSELVALRAAGVSVWQFLFPALAVALVAGIVKVTLINPLSTAMIAQYEQLESKHLRGQSGVLAAAASGVWLRQADGKDQSVIHAQSSRVEAGNLELLKVMVLLYREQDTYAGRIDAERAVLHPGYWELTNGRTTMRDGPAERFESHRIKTDLTIGRIQDSFSSPATISFWELPRFIAALDATGFSTLSHRLHWHSLLAEPMLYCAMILIAAVFSLRHNRRAGVMLAVAGGIGAGFLLFFISDLVLALAHSTQLPPFLAAWAPTVASMLLGLAVLLHVEDG